MNEEVEGYTGNNYTKWIPEPVTGYDSRFYSEWEPEDDEQEELPKTKTFSKIIQEEEPFD